MNAEDDTGTPRDTYVRECAACGARFVGMTLAEFEEVHLTSENCPKWALADLYYPHAAKL